jgi:trimeric autotransporter adhesin
VLVGGSDNEIGRSSSWTVILGGDNNRIGTNCPSAVIPGGTNNLVADNCGFSFAAGRRSRVNHVGAFVWADSQDASFASQDVNTFNLRANGGVRLNGDTSQFFGSSTRQMVNLWGEAYGIGVQSSTFYSRTDVNGSFSWFRGGSHVNTANSPGTGGTELMRLNSGGLRVNGTFVSASDRNLKENFLPVDPRDVLEKVTALPITAWNYKEDRSSRHVGPMAQDFYAAFGVGPDDKHIATVDADGVALAAIQGLSQKLTEELRRCDAENSRLRQHNASLERRLERLERQLVAPAGNGAGS